MIELVFIASVFGLCWGSFLNVVGYRLLHEKPFFALRSHCTSCNAVISWFDNIPVVSWIWLQGHCRFCSQKISLLYPFIEIITALSVVCLYLIHGDNVSLSPLLAYLFLFSALIVGVRTDLEALVIPQLFTLWLIPMGFLFAVCGFLDVGIVESVVGAIVGYGILWVVATLFRVCTKKDGMGVGDMELLAMIGAFIGPVGVWVTLLIASLTGSIIGGIYLLGTKQGKMTRIPFGPFLALGGMSFVLFQNEILSFLRS
jgi:leader peptidase (prepilin peptidase)/N-methyltransferase